MCQDDKHARVAEGAGARREGGGMYPVLTAGARADPVGMVDGVETMLLVLVIHVERRMRLREQKSLPSALAMRTSAGGRAGEGDRPLGHARRRTPT